jgi:hypothetical protein
MKPLSEYMAPKICRYCGNSTGTHCLASVPWYCCSIFCARFRETPAEALKPVKRRRANPLKALVETF